MINDNWDQILNEEYQKTYFIELMTFLKQEYKNKIIYPSQNDLFKALRYTNYDDVKVVILGQDPYHGEGEANGLAFSVSKGAKLQPSLRNIYKELNNDLNIPITNNGDLSCLAKEGVLLLNAVLTVEKDKPASHKKIGWETFTNAIIEKLNERSKPIVFILWGNFARSKKGLITNPKHYLIESPHPSPFSAYNGFFGSKPFSKANHYLKSNNLGEINWQIK